MEYRFSFIGVVITRLQYLFLFFIIDEYIVIQKLKLSVDKFKINLLYLILVKNNKLSD